MVFECKSSKIRIWIHQRDLINLQKVLWEGYGDKLKIETSTNSKVKKFLDAVPYIMGLIKNIHNAAINNDLNALIDLTTNPVPSIIFSSKDLNGLTPLHKAVGLGNIPIVQYIVSRYPESLSITDNEERTVLFYTTLLKNDMNMYDYLVTSGANESHLDKKGKAAAYYRNRTIEIPQYFLRIIPDAPRTTQTNIRNSWNWNLLRTNSAITSNSNSEMNNSSINTSQESISLGISHGNIYHNDDDDDNDDDNVVIINESIAFGEQNDIKIKPEINLNINDDVLIELINEGNLEELASIVLSGDGDTLLNRKTENVESQEFINNVPIYMDKISKVHQAARSGNLKEFQVALDRRKFATSCDKLSPNKATPMHVAVVFAHIKLIKYLGSKFQETLQCEDINGRTPLHYAAVINDNKYLYNLLLSLGANSIFEDNFGKIAEFYINNQEDFSHELLLQQFKAGKSEEVMLIDKVPNDVVTFKRDLDDEATLTLLENCYKIITYRRNLMKNVNSSSLKSMPFGELVYKNLKRSIFDTIKTRITRLDHILYDILWPIVKKLPKTADFRMKIEEDLYGGIFVPDQYSYKAFYEFFDQFLEDLHFINFEVELNTHSSYLIFFNKLISNDIKQISNNLPEHFTTKLNLDPYEKNVVSSRVSLTRNLKEFEFPKSLSMRNLEIVEIILLDKINDRKMAQILLPNSTLNDIDENGSGIYYTMHEVLDNDMKILMKLSKANLLIPIWNVDNSERLHGKFWPYGRGVFLNTDEDIAIYINVLDHIRIVASTKNSNVGNIGGLYMKIYKITYYLNKELQFNRDDKYGFLSSRPNVLGNGLKFNIKINLPFLLKEPRNLRHLCSTRGLSFRYIGNNEITLENKRCLCISEFQTFEDFSIAVKNILELEGDLELSNSKHIALMFLDIFKRRKSNLIEKIHSK